MKRQNEPKRVDFGRCRLCSSLLDEEEYHLGRGCCRDCARKCPDGVGFGTRYGNDAVRDGYGACGARSNAKP